ncbi:hypothetical protein A5884_001137 [Enterococcus sp. 7D2_DIV0200]|uniref:EpsG family protein n=2 Tax=unclassified Enterococcus TaxID=2608891 RepID=UPI000A35A95E|nr:EpsG family protein [Enterococcus sp. 7D2_DIV0200]OTP51942.1 hypothetical protein A5884_001137 [Enterococcus sp. 7D2_DIV0200]
MIYIVFFIVATMLSFCSEFARNRGNKYFYGLLVILLIVTVSILNGTRDFTIGTDIRVYGNKYFELALFSYRFVDYLDLTRSFYNLDVEYGYQALNYLVSRFTNNIHIFYFILGILTNGLFYLGITRFRQWVSIPLSFLTYLFLFYGNTLNIMRQSVAMAFVFLGISLFITSKKRLGIAMLFCSLLFHNSAIVGFAILLLYIILEKSKNTLKLHLTILLSALTVSVSAVTILGMLTKTGLIGNKFEQYIGTNQSESDVSLSTIGMRLPMVVWWIRSYKSLVKKNLFFSFMFLITMMDLIFISLRMIDITVSRVILYLAVFKIISYPLIIKYSIKDKNLRFLCYLLFIGYLILVWYLQVVVGGNGEIYPFTSEILGI